ncbi:MAG: MFS transporter [Planctomycetes bacterium]|nr:MFS transporter [Planctomycetota bacterium]
MPSSPTVPDPRRWIGLGAALVAPFLGVVDFFVLNLALPAIERDLGATYAQLELAIALYGLGNAVFVVTGGRLGDAYGRRRVFLAGTLAFLCASVLVALAPSAWFLLGARLLQGVAAAILFPQVLALVTVLFPDHERPRAFAWFGLTVATAMVVGVVLGGVLLHLDVAGLGWRALFLLNVPIGLAGFEVARRTLHEVRSGDPLRLDFAGVALATLALVAVLVPLSIGHERGWPPWSIALLSSSAPALWAFLRAERATKRRGGDPLVDPALFRLAGYRRGLLVIASYFLGAGSLLLVLSIFEASGLGRDPLRAALSFVPLGCATFLASFLATGGAARRPALFLHGGLASLVAGLGVIVLALALCDGPADAGFGSPRDVGLAAGLALYGFGNGAVSPVLYSTILAGVPARSAGSAAGVLATVQQVAAALGVVLIGLVFATALGRRSGPDAYAHAAAWALSVNVASMVAAALLALRLPRRAASGPTLAPAEPV